MIHQTMHLVEESFCTLHAILSFYLTILFILHSLHRFFFFFCHNSSLLQFCVFFFAFFLQFWVCWNLEFVSRNSFYFSQFWVCCNWVCVSQFCLFLKILSICCYSELVAIQSLYLNILSFFVCYFCCYNSEIIAILH